MHLLHWRMSFRLCDYVNLGNSFTEGSLTTGAATADSETMAQNCGEYDSYLNRDYNEAVMQN